MKQKPSIHIGDPPERFTHPHPTELSKVTSSFAEALTLHKAGRLAEAERNYKEILATEPNHFGSLHLLGVISDQRGSHATAVHQIESALKINPENVLALISRGNALHALNRFDEALVSCDRALAVRPDYAEAHYNRGNALYEMKRFEEALTSYERALTLRPDYVEAQSNRGLALHSLRRFEEALTSYDRALAERRDYAEALANRGVTLHELRRFEEALASYERALTLRPDYVEALFNRGVTLNELKRFGDALASYERALAVRPDDAEALANRSVTLHELGRFEEALASCDRALALRPDYAEAHSNRGNALHALKRFEEALASYDRAIAVRPNYAEALANRGATMHELSDIPDASLYQPRFSPWLGKQFTRYYAIAAPRTLVSADRCYVLYTLLRQALALEGDVWECGVYKGGTAAMLAKIISESGTDRKLFLFDTFAGMPATDKNRDLHQKGDFSDTSAEQVEAFINAPDVAVLRKGYIPETFSGLESRRIAFAHIDVDIYKSVIDSLEFIWPRLSSGGFIVFDDYGFATCPGALQAVDEFFARTQVHPLCLHTGQAVVFKS